MEHEEWRSVVGAEGYYEVSNFGRVRSLPRQFVQLWCGIERIIHWKGGILKGSLTTRGKYVNVLVSYPGHKGQKLVHRWVLEAFVGPCPDGMECRHLDGNRTNNCLDNLVWGTPKENMEDRRIHGRNRSTKLTDEIVTKIRTRYAAGGVIMQDLADEYKIVIATIYTILRGKTWDHLPNPVGNKGRKKSKITS